MNFDLTAAARTCTALVINALSIGAVLHSADAAARDRHPLWSIEGERNTVYLLGSIHVLRPGDGGLPAVADTAYAEAERLLMELDLDDALTADPAALLGMMQRLALLPEGQTLRSVLGDDFAETQRHAQSLGLDLAALERFAPWFVAVVLTQFELVQRGFDPALGIEQLLVARAAKDRKPIAGLETPEQQFSVLAGLSMPQQRDFLRMAIEQSAQFDSEIESLVTAWRNGDTATLARLLGEAYGEFPELYGPLTETRNRAWVGQIEDLLDEEDDYLVVVGALHLVGPHSVLELLRERGHAATQQ